MCQNLSFSISHTQVQQWFSKLAERRNALKNKEWCKQLRDDGIQYWEGEEANRKSLREGGDLGDLLQQRKLPGLRLSRKNLGLASDLLRNSRLEERQMNFERSKRRRRDDYNDGGGDDDDDDDNNISND